MKKKKKDFHTDSEVNCEGVHLLCSLWADDIIKLAYDHVSQMAGSVKGTVKHVILSRRMKAARLSDNHMHAHWNCVWSACRSTLGQVWWRPSRVDHSHPVTLVSPSSTASSDTARYTLLFSPYSVPRDFEIISLRFVIASYCSWKSWKYLYFEMIMSLHVLLCW